MRLSDQLWIRLTAGARLLDQAHLKTLKTRDPYRYGRNACQKSAEFIHLGTGKPAQVAHGATEGQFHVVRLGWRGTGSSKSAATVATVPRGNDCTLESSSHPGRNHLHLNCQKTPQIHR